MVTLAPGYAFTPIWSATIGGEPTGAFRPRALGIVFFNNDRYVGIITNEIAGYVWVGDVKAVTLSSVKA